ncbi:MAG: hypothetical protein AAFX09_10650 [Pseudomonadota bacterium]
MTLEQIILLAGCIAFVVMIGLAFALAGGRPGRFVGIVILCLLSAGVAGAGSAYWMFIHSPDGGPTGPFWASSHDVLTRGCLASERDLNAAGNGWEWERCDCFVSSIQTRVTRISFDRYADAVRGDVYALIEPDVIRAVFSSEEQTSVAEWANQCQVFSVLSGGRNGRGAS